MILLKSSSEKNYVKWSLITILVFFPVLSLTVIKINNFIPYLIFILGAIAFIRGYHPPEISFGHVLIKYWRIHLAMFSIFIAVFIHQIITGDLRFKYYSVSFVFVSFTFCFWMFLMLSSKELKLIQWGLVVASIVSFVFIWIESQGGKVRPMQVIDYYLIPYSTMALLLSFLAFLTIEWNNKLKHIDVLLKVTALTAGLLTSYLSQARGGWVVVPFFLLVLAFFFKSKRKKYPVVMLFAALIFLASFFNSNIKQRLDLITSETQNYISKAEVDTSIGHRLQLWHASLLIFMDNPIVGVGENNFKPELQKLASDNVITSAAASYKHAHNEMLFQMARYGVLGLVAIISVIFVPAYYFFKDINSADREIRSAAWMGLSLTFGSFIFGLTNVQLMRRETSILYVVLLAAFFALIAKKKQELKGEQKHDSFNYLS